MGVNLKQGLNSVLNTAKEAVPKFGEKGKVLFTEKGYKYSDGCPIIILESKLLQDGEKLNVRVRFLVLDNCEKPIKAIIAKVKVLDILGHEIDSEKTLQFLDVNTAGNNEIIGSVELQASNTRNISMRISHVVYEDDTIWEGDASKLIPARRDIKELLEEPGLIKLYEEVIGIENVTTIPEHVDPFWYCACGRISTEEICPKCKTSIPDMISFLDVDELKKEFEEKKRKEEEEQKKQNQEKVKKAEEARRETEKKQIEKKAILQAKAKEAKKRFAAASGYFTWLGVMISWIVSREFKKDDTINSHRNISFVLNLILTVFSITFLCENHIIITISFIVAAIVIGLSLICFVYACRGKKVAIPMLSKINILGKIVPTIIVVLIAAAIVGGAEYADFRYCKNVTNSISEAFQNKEMMNLSYAVPDVMKKIKEKDFEATYQFNTDKEIAYYSIEFIGAEEYEADPLKLLQNEVDGVNKSDLKKIEQDGAKVYYIDDVTCDEGFVSTEAVLIIDKSTYYISYHALEKYYSSKTFREIIKAYKFKDYKSPAVTDVTASYDYPGEVLGYQYFSKDYLKVVATYDNGKKLTLKNKTYKVEAPEQFIWGSNIIKIITKVKELEIEVVTPTATLEASYTGDTEAGSKVTASKINATLKYTSLKTGEAVEEDVSGSVSIDGEVELSADAVVTIVVSAKGLTTNLTVECSTLSESKFCSLCGSVSYDSLTHDSEALVGTKIKLYGKVLQVGSGYIRLGTSGYGYYDNVVYVNFNPYGGGTARSSDMVEDDMVTIYGLCAGTKTYTTVLGASKTLPQVSCKYASR